MKHILIVCRGNIVRSPFAEAVINRELKRRKLDDQIEVISRGTQGTAVDPIPVKYPNITFYEMEFRFSKPTLDKFKIDYKNQVSQPVTRNDTELADVIFAVDDKNKKALNHLFPDLKSKIHKLSELIDKDSDFTDPETIAGIENHAKILTEIHNTIINGFPKLLSLVNEIKND